MLYSVIFTDSPAVALRPVIAPTPAGGEAAPAAAATSLASGDSLAGGNAVDSVLARPRHGTITGGDSTGSSSSWASGNAPLSQAAVNRSIDSALQALYAIQSAPIETGSASYG